MKKYYNILAIICPIYIVFKIPVIIIYGLNYGHEITSCTEVCCAIIDELFKITYGTILILMFFEMVEFIIKQQDNNP